MPDTPSKLYGAQTSYFTGKVRSCLRWKTTAFNEIPAAARVLKDIIVPRGGFPVTPLAVTSDGSCFQNSTAIIRAHMHAAIDGSYEKRPSDFSTHFKRYSFLFGNQPSISGFTLIGSNVT